MAVYLTSMWQSSALNVRFARSLIALRCILQSFILQAFMRSLKWTLVSELRTVLILTPLMPWASTDWLANTLMGKLVAGQGWPSYL